MLTLLRVSFLLTTTIIVAGCLTVREPTPEPQIEPEPAPQPAPEEPPLPQLSPRGHEEKAIELLQEGDMGLAQRHLIRALELNPNSKRAKLLLDQLVVNPNEYLGEKYFMYTVRDGDTLSKLAMQFLGDRLKFPILAKYNDIKTPKDLIAGQRIKIPGSALPEELMPPRVPSNVLVNAEALHEQALETESQGDIEGAYAVLLKAVQLDPSFEPAQQDLERIKAMLIKRYQEEAYSYEEKNGVQEAIQLWQKVLKIDPNNIAAQINLNRLNDRVE
jgi:tetratricopeptide (TPR) repeat protein